MPSLLFAASLATSLVHARPGPPLRFDFGPGAVRPSFFFSARIPAEGNYRVTVTPGDQDGESVSTIKGELRRLMVEEVRTRRGQHRTVTFVVSLNKFRKFPLTPPCFFT